MILVLTLDPTGQHLLLICREQLVALDLLQVGVECGVGPDHVRMLLPSPVFSTSPAHELRVSM